MTNLDNVNKKLYHTYHSKKNREVLPIVIFWSVIVIIFNNPLFWELLVWGIYYLYCDSNNKKLVNDPENLRERTWLIKTRNQLLSGELEIKEID